MLGSESAVKMVSSSVNTRSLMGLETARDGWLWLATTRNERFRVTLQVQVPRHLQAEVCLGFAVLIRHGVDGTDRQAHSSRGF